MRNHEVTQRHPLLDEHGSLKEAGWSRSLLQEYRREDIKVKRWRIKEWDYYLILNDFYGVAFTISDDGYIGLQSVSLLDFKKGWEHTETILNAFPMGKLKLPTSSESGSCRYRDKRLDMEFQVMKGKRILRCDFQNFYEGKPFHCEITLHQPDMDSMVIATPGTGETETALWKENCLASMSATALAIRQRPVKIYCCMMVLHTSWRMLPSTYRRTAISSLGVLHPATHALKCPFDRFLIVVRKQVRSSL